MIKRTMISIIAIFVAWSLLDFVIHGVLLQQAYVDTAHLWRPMHEMNMPLMYLVTLGLCHLLRAHLSDFHQEQVIAYRHEIRCTVWNGRRYFDGIWLVRLHADPPFAGTQLVCRHAGRVCGGGNTGWPDSEVEIDYSFCVR